MSFFLIALQVCYHEHQCGSIVIKSSNSQSSNCSNSQKHFEFTIDRNFTIDRHIDCLCQKSSQKLHVCLQYHNIYNQIKNGKTFFKPFVTSQFDYCPLFWICHSRTLNNRINNIHHRDLKIAYQDKK